VPSSCNRVSEHSSLPGSETPLGREVHRSISVTHRAAHLWRWVTLTRVHQTPQKADHVFLRVHQACAGRPDLLHGGRTRAPTCSFPPSPPCHGQPSALATFHKWYGFLFRSDGLAPTATHGGGGDLAGRLARRACRPPDDKYNGFLFRSAVLFDLQLRKMRYKLVVLAAGTNTIEPSLFNLPQSAIRPYVT